MPPRRRRTVLVPPREHCWIESDAFDRSMFAALRETSPSLANVIETGAHLLPHFGALLEDVFALLFKLEPRMRSESEGAASALVNRALLATLLAHPILEHVRSETQLDEVQAGLGTVLMGEHVLGLLREERVLPRGDMVDLFELARQEDELRDRADDVASLDTPPDGTDPAATDHARDRLGHQAEVAEARLRQKTRQVRDRVTDLPSRAKGALPMAAAGLTRQLAEARENAEHWGDASGGDGRTPVGRKIELGRRLATNPKLKRLAGAVGRMRALALAVRKRTFERVSEETHAVAFGSELAHLLPPELLAIRHPILRRDFQRRLVEGKLLGYELRGIDDRGRGPMVVCLDGSSSMAGEKEVWAKAVALTLLEIARRQRRLFRFICFASADTPLYTLDLNPRDHHRVAVDRTFDVAEYFPGGGTDFERPLTAAIDTLADARYRRGDIVLITDGECRVGDDWLARFRADKARLRCTVFSVLIDEGGTSATDTLAAVSDRVTSVSRLNDDAARDLFVRMT